MLRLSLIFYRLRFDGVVKKYSDGYSEMSVDNKIKIVLVFLMTTALAAGFFAEFVANLPYNPERLHIFLFNLCAGGTILIYHSEQMNKMSLKSWIFLTISLFYAFFAFFELYIATIVCSVVLAIIVESVREKRYSFFPHDFFSSKALISEKFNHAALLCLVLGLLISSIVILNNKFFCVVTIEKLELDTFFLGFSFPLSLISMSVMFSLMEKNDSTFASPYAKNACFWLINLGVIIFFGFILLDVIIPQVVVTAILFITVVMLFYIFFKSVKNIQQKAFLVSGMMFLVYTAISGILYIVLHFTPQWYEHGADFLIRLHAFSALYGWNLSGLLVICRYNDFPIKLRSTRIIISHWVIVALLAPLGRYNKIIAIATILAYLTFLIIIFFSKEKNTNMVSSHGD